jgi:hypothetical protein
MRGFALLAVACAALTACGSEAGAGPLSGDPAHYLVRLDQFVSADFSVYVASHPVAAAALASGDTSLQQQLTQAGFQAASTVRYTRTADFATSNGPLDVTSTVERFAASSGAAGIFTHDVAARDASGETPLSTGPLGDAAHADTVVRDTTSGVQAVQITLEWRVANVINVLVIRGRYGGARLGDALTLAHRQTANETAS